MNLFFVNLSGVITNQLALSDQTVLGNWQIKVVVKVCFLLKLNFVLKLVPSEILLILNERIKSCGGLIMNLIALCLKVGAIKFKNSNIKIWVYCPLVSRGWERA